MRDPELKETYEAILRDFGEVVQLIPLAAEAERWILENLERGAVWFGDGVLVELPYIHPILDAMEGDGINVRISVES